jgi:hypothetical protein
MAPGNAILVNMDREEHQVRERAIDSWARFVPWAIGAGIAVGFLVEGGSAGGAVVGGMLGVVFGYAIVWLLRGRRAQGPSDT